MTPLPGISSKIVDDERRQPRRAEARLLVVDQPWPAMLRGIWGDPSASRRPTGHVTRSRAGTSPATAPARTRTATLAARPRRRRHERLRPPDLHHREVESALVATPVAEAAVVGGADETTGQGVCAFVILPSTARSTGERSSRNCASTCGDRARSRSRGRSRSCPSFPRPARARSCGACSATSPRAARSATPRRWSIPRCSTRSAE